mmetsp:Transcript_7682/g.16774  ORF Transcript_7682/g.16774 Transcript_7682/m.16774 type:complete len:305 (-) Transcript_7682:41-955(-)
MGARPSLSKVGGELDPTHCVSAEPINTAFLRMMQLADERVTAYAAAYNMPSSPLYRAVERAENTPPLARVAALQSSINADAIFEWRRRVETDPERLEGRNDFLKGSRRLVTAKECIAELDLPETRALFTAVAPDSLVPPLNTLRNTLNKRQLSLLLSEARCRKHDAQGGAEPEPQPQAPEQVTLHVQQMLTDLLHSHPFTSPIRAGVVAGAEFDTSYNISRTETIATVPEGLFAKELRTYAQSHESGSQPSTCSGQVPVSRGGVLTQVAASLPAPVLSAGASASSASVSPRGSSDSEMITNQQG